MKGLISFFLFLTLVVPTHADAARLWSSGCEFQSDSPGNVTSNLEFEKFETGAGSTLIDTTIKRSGNSSCESTRATSGFSALGHTFVSAPAAGPYVARFYIYIATTPAVETEIADWENSGDSRSMLTLTTSRTLKLISADDTTVLATDSTVLATATWYRIEYEYSDVSNIKVRIDGTQVINVSGDGANVEYFEVGLAPFNARPTTGTLYFDDLAINDTTGGSQTLYPGAGSIVHMQPDGSAGDNNGASSGTCADVDEVTPDNATTIAVLNDDGDNLDCTVESSSAAGIDSYDTVSLVQIGTRQAASAAASMTWALRVKSASGGTAVPPGTSTSHNDTSYDTNGDGGVPPRNYTLTSYTDPTTAIAWTPTGTNSLDNMQVGMNAVAATLADINLSTLWALVEYVDGVAPGATDKMRLRLNASRIKISGGRVKVQSN